MAIDSSDPELNGADFVLHDDHDPLGFGRKTDEMHLGEHLDGREPAGQKHNGNSEEPNGADHASELTKPEEDRDDTEEPRYGVEAIVGHTIYEETKVNLHVKWIGYPERTLVDECIIQQDCPAMLYSLEGYN
ncbi:hypothetical protein B0J13DRAFT_630677 [Dactylonectria estremocensis]|uniref:Chromo domain-containing protein n=1 Tax=Dactylonectria estremocensis TaxID=1079267 RepID=A0A9P9IBM7_9HYPO|nr:hypothetical protein B0J13DRAFT_630677 [Dactylonectria estremocensis]